MCSFSIQRVQPLLIIICLSGGSILGTTSTAEAQILDSARNFSAQRFRVARGKESVLNVQSAIVPDQGSWDVDLTLHYLDDPVVFNAWGTSQEQRYGSLLKEQYSAQLGGAYSFNSWLQLGIDIPIVFYQYRSHLLTEDPRWGLEQIGSAGIGDLAITPKLALLKRKHLHLSFLARTTLATAQPRSAYLGERKSTVHPELALHLGEGRLQMLANVGVMFREFVAAQANLFDIEHEAIARLGGRYTLGSAKKLALTASTEWFTQTKEPFSAGNITGGEWAVGAEYQVSNHSQLYAGMGSALDSAYSVPDWRAFIGLRFYHRRLDKDKDGIEDANDRCPDVPEDKDGFEDSDGCPDLDNDGDGIPDRDDGAPNDPEDKDGFEDSDGIPDRDNDADSILDDLDKCPNQPEDFDGFEDGDGCPESDNDQDGIPDTQDGAPNQPEDFDGFEDEDGIPDRDNDGDGVADVVDNCPMEPGPKSNRGCKRKQLVAVSQCRIDLSQRVYFELGKSTIRSRSFALLNNVAEVLSNHVQIKKLRVEGHTDSRGSAIYNLKLSQSRAESVRNYLVQQGVSLSRLQAIGFGEQSPIESNQNAEGRTKNRRVEFRVENCIESTPTKQESQP